MKKFLLSIFILSLIWSPRPSSAAEAADAADIKACEHGDGKACEKVGGAWMKQKKYDEAVKYFIKACEDKEKGDCYRLGLMYKAPLLYQGFQGSLEKALIYYTKACALDPFNCNEVARLYQSNDGPIPRDLKKAAEYYDKVCEAKAPNFNYESARKVGCQEAKRVRDVTENGSWPGIVDEKSDIQIRGQSDLPIVQKWVEGGADINKQDAEGLTLLMVAAYHAHADVVKYLLEKGADAKIKNKRNETALTLIAPGFHIVPDMKTFKDRKKGVWDPKPLMKLLVEHGANVNAANKRGMTALLFFSQRCDLDGIKYLVEHGADVKATNSVKQNVLWMAALPCDETLAEYLLKNGADPSVAMEMSNDEASAQRFNGSTPLNQAVESCNVGFIKALLNHGVDTNVRDGRGNTPLISLASIDAVPSHWDQLMTVLKMMIDHKADINATAKNGNSLLLTAVSHNHPDIVKFALEHRADVNIKNSWGQSAVALARVMFVGHSSVENDSPNPNEMPRASRKEMEDLLVSHGAKAE